MPPAPAVPLPALPTVFTVAEARARGATRARLRRTDLDVPLHGVRVLPGLASPTWVDVGFAVPRHGWSLDRMTALQRLRPDGVFSHGTAAHLHGLPRPMPDVAAEPVAMTVPPRTDIRRAGVRAHRRPVPPEQLGRFHGLRITSPERTWVDLCALGPPWTEEDLVAAADHLVRRPWVAGGRLAASTTIDRLAAVLETGAPFHGIGRARAALELARVGADSPMETRLRLALVRAGLGEPALQHRPDPLDDDCPEADLYYADGRVALQYDGAHHLTREQQARDARRDRWLLSRGIAPVRVTVEDHRDGYRRVIALVRERRRRP